MTIAPRTNTCHLRFGLGIPRAAGVSPTSIGRSPGLRTRRTASWQESAAAVFVGDAQRVKVTALLEELDLGHTGAEYDAYTINIGEGQQFGSDFVDINPNSKIPRS